MRTLSVRRVLFCIALSAVGAAGCAERSATLTTPVANEQSQPPAPARELESANQSTPNPSDFVIDTPPSTEYESAGSQRMVIQRETATVGLGGSPWIVRRFVSNVGGQINLSRPATREQQFQIDADGSLVLLWETNREEKVEVEFAPGLLVLPSGLGPGASREQTIEMIVHPLGNRSRVQRRGPLTNRVTVEGWERVPAGGGEVEAIRVHSLFTAELKPATVVNESTQWFAPTLGLVREIEHERTKALGLTVRDNTSSWQIVR